MPKFASQIDTLGIPIKGLRSDSGTAFPADPVEGLMFHRSDQKKTYTYLDGAWRQTDAQDKASAGHVHTADSINETGDRRFVPGGGSNGQFLKWVDSNLVWTVDNNTTYSAGDAATLTAGSDGTARLWSAAILKQGILHHTPVNKVAGKIGDVTLVKGDVGLGNVDNTSDAAKPISTATQTALNGKANAVHNHHFDTLADVLINNAAAGQSVVFRNGAWTNEAITTSTIGAAPASHTHTTSQVSGLDSALSGKVGTGRKINPGTGLTGGGDLTADRSLAVVYGTGAGTAMEGNKRLNNIGASADVPMSNFKITNLGTPTAASDAATKGYVDTAIQGLSVKQSVRVATTANVTLSATQTIDGVAVVAGDRVLVKNQTDGKQNGIYVVATGAWTRSLGTDGTGDLQNGAFFFVEEGSTQADSGWVMTTDGTITVGTTALSFVQFSGAGQIVAGNGLTKSGNTLAVGSGTGITSSGNTVSIASNYAGQSSITTVGNITSGTWNGSTLAVNKGGTGATNAAQALTNLGASGTVHANFATMTAGTWYDVRGVNGFLPAHISAIASGLGSIELDWEGKDVENIRVKADVALTGVQVIVTGFPV